MSVPPQSITFVTATALEAGQAAFQAGDFAGARRFFGHAIAEQETPEAFEQLGLTAWWLDDAALTFDSRERAYTLFRDRDDARGAARVALWLVWDSLAFRGDTAVASGWLERARRLLTGHEDSAEFGWFLLREGEVALFRGNDPQVARANATQASAIGRATGDRGLEMTGLALEGLALVSLGEIETGMRRLDEATAAVTGGEVKELHTVGLVCCWQIFACERVRDYDRAAQWCDRVREFGKRWSLRPLSAVCRTQYAGVLIWRGAWTDAEEELTAAVREFEQIRPGQVGQALARLGDLRLRQGRLDEARELFAQSASQPISRLGQAWLALETGHVDEAIGEIERFVANLKADEMTLRAGAMELAVRAHCARGDEAAASDALEQLQRIATTFGTVPLSATAAAATGEVAQLRGDLGSAATWFGRSVDLYEEAGAPFETARMRCALAPVLAAIGQQAAAERERRSATEGFRSLGVREAPARQEPPSDLTARQIEILRLVAKGMSNPEIAKRLELSEHTVKRHVANLLTKLGLSSRSAAVAYAARRGLL